MRPCNESVFPRVIMCVRYLDRASRRTTETHTHYPQTGTRTQSCNIATQRINKLNNEL